MEKYKNSLKYKLVLGVCCLLLAFAIIITFFCLYNRNPINEFSKGFQFGVALGILIYSVIGITLVIAQMKSPKTLKKAYINKTDDREKLIQYKAANLAQQIICLLSFVAMFISLYFDMLIFYTLLISCFFTCIIHIITKLYYRRVL